jgi:DNA polymerase III sliding clamp (beta) subunit (PCNA family)
LRQRYGPDEKPFSIAFNHKYLLDGLKAMKTEQVTLLCTFANSPAVFCPFHPLAPADATAEGLGTASADAATRLSWLSDMKTTGGENAKGELEYLIMPMQLPSHEASAWVPL